MSLGEAAQSPGKTRYQGLTALVGRLHGQALGKGSGDQAGSAAIFAFLVRVAGAGIAYFSQVLLARWMGSFEYGIFVFVWVWVLILGGLAPLGLSTACMRFVAEYRETNQSPLLRGLIHHARLIALGTSTLIAFAGAASLYLLGHMIAGYYMLPFFLILFCLPMYTLVDVQDGIARGRGWMDLALLPPYVYRPLILLFTMGSMWLTGYDMSAVNAAGAAVFACWVSAVIQLVQLDRRTSADIGRGGREYKTAFWMQTSLPLFLVHGFELLLQNTDILVLSRYVDPSQLAVYFAALKTISLVAFVHFAVAAVSAGRFAGHNARGDSKALQQSVNDAVSWTFWPSLAGVVLLLLLGKPLLWLFGADFVEGYPVMFVLAAGLLLRAATGPVEFILNMLGEQKICAVLLFASAGGNLVLNFALIPLYGLTGAAIATALSMALAAFAMAYVARKRLSLDSFIWSRVSG